MKIRLSGLGWLVVIAATIVALFVLFRGTNEEEEGEGPVLSPSPASSEAVDDYAVPRQRTIELIEAYTLIEPGDTPTDRRERVEGLGFLREPISQVEALGQLTYEIMPLQCVEPSGQQVALWEKAVVDPSAVSVVPSDDRNPYVYVIATYMVALFTDEGERYRGSPECLAEAEPTVTALWSEAGEGSWQLVTVFPPEVMS